MLLHNYKSANSYLVMKFIGKHKESTPVPYPDLDLQEMKMKIMKKFNY